MLGNFSLYRKSYTKKKILKRDCNKLPVAIIASEGHRNTRASMVVLRIDSVHCYLIEIKMNIED